MAKLPFRLPGFWNEGRTPPKKTASRKAVPVLKMFFFIVDWDKAGAISKVFEEEHVRFHFISKGRGTANSDVYDMLGIGATDKAVIVCVEQEILVQVLLKEVRKKLGFHKPGAGIAFIVPLSGINTPLLRVFKESINKNEKITRDEYSAGINKGGTIVSGKQTVISNDLILAVINHGYSEEFMNVAREAGATGGTVVHARGLAHEGPIKFFGVSVQEEKEIVLVLTGREKKLSIMEAVSRSCGITTKAEGLIFSLPVENVMGLNLE